MVRDNTATNVEEYTCWQSKEERRETDRCEHAGKDGSARTGVLHQVAKRTRTTLETWSATHTSNWLQFNFLIQFST